jgi:hypothetical protein
VTSVAASHAWKTDVSAEEKAMINGAAGKHNAKAKKIMATRKLKEESRSTTK